MADITSLRLRFGKRPEAERVRGVKPKRTNCHDKHKGQCLKCLHEGTVYWWPSMTMYEYTKAERDAGKPDPNADLELCEVCGPEHIQEMTDQWDEYNRGLL